MSRGDELSGGDDPGSEGTSDEVASEAVSEFPELTLPYTEDDRVFPETRALRETALALYVVTKSGLRGWVPKSQIRKYSDCYYPGDVETLVVSRWWAEKVKWEP